MAKGAANKGGRPQAITEEAILKLEEVFRLGITIDKACEHAGIDDATFYRRASKDKAFASRITRAKNYGRIAAGALVISAITKDQDVNTAKWYLEHKHSDEFNVKQQIDSTVKSEVVHIYKPGKLEEGSGMLEGVIIEDEVPGVGRFIDSKTLKLKEGE